jgi:hypothetical protein
VIKQIGFTSFTGDNPASSEPSERVSQVELLADTLEIKESDLLMPCKGSGIVNDYRYLLSDAYEHRIEETSENDYLHVFYPKPFNPFVEPIHYNSLS